MKPLSNGLATWLIAFIFGAAFSLKAELREAPPNIQAEGAPLDVSAWNFRKAVAITQPGVQQLELDLDVLSHAQPGFDDLRLIRDGKQVSYIIERTSIQRTLTPVVTVTNSIVFPAFTRWSITLPKPNLPVTRLSCVARTPLFQREMTLYELVADERGTLSRRILVTYASDATWTQTPNRKSREFSLTLNVPPETDSLGLETPNGDNPPIELENFQVFYPVTRMVFKAYPTDELFLYYGNPAAVAPHYDLSLVANKLVTADKAIASSGAEEQLKYSWRENQRAGQGGIVFWGILALVVVVLLVIISRLLPKSEPQPPK